MTSVIECDSIKQLEENVEFAVRFSPMPDDMAKTLIKNIAPYARQLMYYKP